MRHMIQDLPDSIDGIQTLEGRTFSDKALAGAGPIVVEFMSYGCDHCRAIEPAFQKVAKELKSKETFFRVNIALERELAESFDIQGTPTFVMLLNGNEVGRAKGLQPIASAVRTALTQPFDS
ncbi:MAG: thioredoxin family protein [Proteobacteria bacterium]|nr:thioredoxin family protein [Pseudomonadota bacterium]